MDKKIAIMTMLLASGYFSRLPSGREYIRAEKTCYICGAEHSNNDKFCSHECRLWYREKGGRKAYLKSKEADNELA